MSTFPFPDVTPNEVSWTLVSNTGVFHSPLTGAIQTNDRTGERWMARLTFRNLKGADARRLQSFLASLNGQQHRFTFFDPSYVKAGSVAASEIVTNSIFSDGTTGWSLTSSDVEFHAISGGIRAKQVTGTDRSIISDFATSVVGSSYALIGDFSDFNRINGTTRVAGGTSVSTVDLASESYAIDADGRKVLSFTAPDTAVRISFAMLSANVGEIFDIHRGSMSRAFLIDNGFNALLWSEEFDNAAWTKSNSTIGADATAAPDSASTADELVEDATAGVLHFASQSYTRAAAVEYWTCSVYIKSNTSQRIRLLIDDGSANGAVQFFDATTGQEEATVATAGSGASNPYSSMHDVGDGWYRCRISVRLPSATTVRAVIYLCDGASNTFNFDGDGTSGLYIWGAQLQRGGQLGRYTPTTDTVSTGTGQTGKQIWLKGLDLSTNGQLLPGDQMEINGQLVRLTSDLDGDAEGIGLAEVSPRIRNAPDDEAPAILYRPHGKFLLANPQASWASRPGIFSDFSFDIIEDIA